MRVEESIVIDRAPEEVFDFFSQRSNDSLWMGTVEESEWLEPEGAEGLGRRGRMVMKAGGRRSEYIDEVTAWEPGRLVAHRAVDGPMELGTACVAEAAGDDRCRAIVIAETQPKGVVGRLIDPVIARVIRRDFKADLARLKDILETEPASTSGGA